MPTPEHAKEKTNENEKIKLAVDFSDFGKTIDDILKDQAEKIENGKEIKKFIHRLREDSIPALQNVIQMMVPTYAYRDEIADIKTAYEIFLKVVELDDARVKKIAAEVIKKNGRVDAKSKKDLPGLKGMKESKDSEEE